MPGPAANSGNTNILAPTVFPVMRSAVERTGRRNCSKKELASGIIVLLLLLLLVPLVAPALVAAHASSKNVENDDDESARVILLVEKAAKSLVLRSPSFFFFFVLVLLGLLLILLRVAVDLVDAGAGCINNSGDILEDLEASNSRCFTIAGVDLVRTSLVGIDTGEKASINTTGTVCAGENNTRVEQTKTAPRISSNLSIVMMVVVCNTSLLAMEG